MERFLIAACHRIQSANGLIGEIQTLSTQTLGGTFARFNIQKLVHGRQLRVTLSRLDAKFIDRDRTAVTRTSTQMS
ncbi:MAG TPA: hypothetical protein VGA33_05870 [Thermoanaerobaculia bacterium]